jgi:hypothetical protein
MITLFCCFMKNIYLCSDFKYYFIKKGENRL